MKRIKHVLAVGSILAALTLSAASVHADPLAVYIEDMTWTEINGRMQTGATSVILPVGGLEQNGPQMTINKHNIIVRYTAGEIAKRLGGTLVAPVITYVPEGRINPPEGHMQFAGTMSVSETTFTQLLEDACASLKQHGFRNIYIIGDHGGTQQIQSDVAERLTSMWQSSGTRVIHVSDYYANNGQEQWAESIGTKTPNPLAHAGLVDTSELMAIDALSVRADKLGKRTEHDYRTTGSSGDSTKASADLGRRFLSLKIEAAVKQINGTAYRAK